MNLMIGSNRFRNPIGLFLITILFLALGVSNGQASAPHQDAHSAVARPPLITGLKLMSLERNLKYLSITWDKSPNKYKVDSYAIYIDNNTTLDQAGGVLIDLTQKNSASIRLGYNDFLRVAYRPAYASIRAGTDARIWVIAHNATGWGDNAPRTANPNYWLSNKIQTVFDDFQNSPLYLGVHFPCINAAKLLGLCN